MYALLNRTNEKFNLKFVHFCLGGISEDAGGFLTGVFQILPPSLPQRSTNPKHSHWFGRLLGESNKQRPLGKCV